MIPRCLLLPILLALPPSLAFSEEETLSSEQRVFFESKIRPVLVEYCYQCHATDEKVRGGLTVDTRDGFRHGGDSGSAVVPGDLEGSLLWSAINWSDDLEMPPKQRLPKEVIDDVREWILMGAPDPRVAEDVTLRSEIDIEAGRSFWAFQAPKASEPPVVRDTKWPTSEVDRFVLVKLEAAGLRPASDATPHHLLRRLSVDLTGLLPSPEAIESFLKAYRQDSKAAYLNKIEELLDSDQFGERWGRHWLDVARYGESSGKEVNMTYPQAWRYRDYVIDAFNEDKPYDCFVREQVAGDLLPIDGDEEWQTNLTATGFLALGPKGLNERNPRQFALDVADEQIDTTTQAVLGITVACARCHDHKSDPIPTTDYYALSGIFQSTQTFFGTVNAATNRRGTKLLELPLADPVPVKTFTRREIEFLENRLASAEGEMAELAQAARRDRMQSRRGSGPAGASANVAANRQQLLRLRSTTAVL